MSVYPINIDYGSYSDCPDLFFEESLILLSSLDESDSAAVVPTTTANDNKDDQEESTSSEVVINEDEEIDSEKIVVSSSSEKEVSHEVILQSLDGTVIDYTSQLEDIKNVGIIVILVLIGGFLSSAFLRGFKR